MDEDIIEVQKLYQKLTADLILSGVNPLLIAGVMNAQSVKMYELNMSDKNERKERFDRHGLKIIDLGRPNAIVNFKHALYQSFFQSSLALIRNRFVTLKHQLTNID